MEEIIKELDELKMKVYITKLFGISCVVLSVILFVCTSLRFYYCIAIMLLGRYQIQKSKDKNEEYRMQYKKKLVKNILQTIFDDVDYDPESGVNQYHLNNIRLKDLGNNIDSYDYISGTYKGVQFAWGNVYGREIKNKKNEVKEKNKFSGHYMDFVINKKIDGEVQMHTCPEYELYYKLEEIKFEDYEFNKIIKTHATSQHEAFYLITPQWFERFKELYKTYNGKIDLCFKEEKLYALVKDYNINCFEPSFIWKIDLERAKRDVEQAVKDIKNYIDILKLHN